MKEIITHISKRATADTPELFARIRNIAIIVAAIAGVLLSLPVTWPAWVVSALTLIVAVCSSIAGTSQLTVKDNDLSNEFEKIIEKNKTKGKNKP